jgi:hypothetical protein
VPGLDNRKRDTSGHVREKSGIDTLRQTYGDDFAPGLHAGATLEDVA